MITFEVFSTRTGTAILIQKDEPDTKKSSLIEVLWSSQTPQNLVYSIHLCHDRDSVKKKKITQLKRYFPHPLFSKKLEPQVHAKMLKKIHVVHGRYLVSWLGWMDFIILFRLLVLGLRLLQWLLRRRSFFSTCQVVTIGGSIHIVFEMRLRWPV